MNTATKLTESRIEALCMIAETGTSGYGLAWASDCADLRLLRKMAVDGLVRYLPSGRIGRPAQVMLTDTGRAALELAGPR